MTLHKTCQNDGANLPGFLVYQKLEFEERGHMVNFGVGRDRSFQNCVPAIALSLRTVTVGGVQWLLERSNRRYGSIRDGVAAISCGLKVPLVGSGSSKSPPYPSRPRSA